MNKMTIASVALLASTQASALIGPVDGKQPEPRTICLSQYVDQNELVYLGDCDETERNIRWEREILENGCAAGQAAMVTLDAEVRSCPAFVQL